MTKQQLLEILRSEGFDDKILKAFKEVDREKFVPPEYKELTYEDRPLPIGFDQTISQPTTIAFMLSKLNLINGKILEVGSGSGYVLELMHNIAPDAKIIGTERIKELAARSSQMLSDLEGVKIVHTEHGVGLPSDAPFDRILVSASARELPGKLIAQLSEGGRIVCPVRSYILVLDKINGKIRGEQFPGFAFVKLYES